MNGPGVFNEVIRKKSCLSRAETTITGGSRVCKCLREEHPTQRKQKGQSHEKGLCLAYLRNSKEASISGTGVRMVRYEV